MKTPLYLDLETTGLDPKGDEIIEIAILDENENVLLDTFVKPVHVSQWPEAQAINGISPDMVKDAPELSELKQQIREITKGSELFIWNAPFDLGFLGGYLCTRIVHCAMREYGDFIEQNFPDSVSRTGRYKLEYTANDLGIEVEGDAHRAKHDVLKMIRIRKAWRSLGNQRPDLSGSVNVEAYR